MSQEKQWENVLKGNYSRLSFTHNQQRYLVKCLYAPNRDSVDDDDNNQSSVFFKEVFRLDEDTEYEHIIMTGDFNVAPDHTNNMS